MLEPEVEELESEPVLGDVPVLLPLDPPPSTPWDPDLQYTTRVLGVAVLSWETRMPPKATRRSRARAWVRFAAALWARFMLRDTRPSADAGATSTRRRRR